MLSRPGIDIHVPALLIRIGQLVLTFILAELSYRWIESPIRHQGFRSSLRSWQATLKLWSIPQKVGVGAAIISAGLLLIWKGSLPVAEIRPDSVLALQDTSSFVDRANLTPTKPFPPNTQQVLSGPTSTRPTIAVHNDTVMLQSTPAATPLSKLPDITLIADSIMQGAAPMIDDVLGQNVYIDAARKRHMEDVSGLIESLAEEGHLGRVGVAL